MWELRLFIAVIGLLILALIYYFGNRKPNISNPDVPDDELYHLEPQFNTEENLQTADQKLTDTSQNNQKKIITLFLHAKDGLQFDWHQIRDAAEKAGLEFGHDQLYYRYRRIGNDRETLFLVANMLKPGIFDVDMRTTGLAFIISLPGAMNALDLWDTLFPVAKRMTEILDGFLTDDNHNAFSRQRIASMREEMRSFESEHGI